MPKLTIEGIPKKVIVDDSFVQQSPEMQDAIVQDIARQYKAHDVASDIAKYGKMGAGELAMTAVSNIPSSAGAFVSGMAQPILHPIETATTIGKIGKGVMQKLGIMSGKEAEPYADAVGKFLVDRYGSGSAILRTLATDPVGMAADISMVLSGGGTAAARLPGVAGRLGEAAATAGRAIDPITLATQGARGAAYVGSAVTRGAMAPQATARADISRALQRDTMTPQAAQAAGLAASADRPGVTLADVGGENIRGLTERVAQTPGAGRTIVTPALTARQEQQAGRIADDLKGLTGTKRTAVRAVTETMAERARTAQPLYQVALQDGDKAVWSPVLERMSSSPTVQSAMQGAVRVWRDNAIADGFGAMNPGAMVERGGQLKFLSGKVPVFPNLQFWDYTKRILDDKIASAKRAGLNEKVRTLTKLTSTMRSELDRQVPSYAAARDAWAGPSAYLDALEEGRNILSRNVSAEEFAASFGALSLSQKAAQREGAVSTIIGRMGTDPAKLGDMTKYLRSPEVRKKVAAIMPTPEAAAAWERRLNMEVKSSELVGQALRGSATARRLAEMQDAESLVGDLVMHAFTGAPTRGTMTRMVIAVGNKLRDTLRSKTDKEIARILTSPSALKSLPKALEGGVTPKSPVLLKQLPLRQLGQSAFQTGRITDAAGNVYPGGVTPNQQ